MERTERFYKIDQLLNERRSTSMEYLLEALGVSKATIKRDLEYLRDRMNAPIEWDATLRGYHYASHQGTKKFALPGMWFNASEIHALLTMEHLLAGLQPEFLASHIEPLRTRIQMLLDSGDHSVDEVRKKIRILHIASRPVIPENFQTISTALLSGKRLLIEHYNRHNDTTLAREVSPRRMIYYRDNWYLDAWCHLRNALRSFSIDVISKVEILDKNTKSVSDKKLDSTLGAGYGIFSGKKTQQAVLKFTQKRSRWVSRETWHPQQTGRTDSEGCYILQFPYSNDTEVSMDILKYGPDVEVLKPKELRERIVKLLAEAINVYQ